MAFQELFGAAILSALVVTAVWLIPPSLGDGVTYVHWGRTTCPSGASVVFEGFTAGSHYAHNEGGSNYICMVNNPQSLHYKATAAAKHHNAGTTTLLYSTAYGAAATWHRHRIEHFNAPCALCYVSGRSTKITVPGSYQCPESWTREYYGWLVASGDKARSKFVCLDHSPDVVSRRRRWDYGHSDSSVFYPVRAGNLPHYTSKRELSCAICTK